jgi:hypothetical protein
VPLAFPSEEPRLNKRFKIHKYSFCIVLFATLENVVLFYKNARRSPPVEPQKRTAMSHAFRYGEGEATASDAAHRAILRHTEPINFQHVDKQKE